MAKQKSTPFAGGAVSPGSGLYTGDIHPLLLRHGLSTLGVYDPLDASSCDINLIGLALQSALDEAIAGWSAGYTPKGEASVSTLNGLTGQSNGDVYILTDSGTLTDGSLAVSAGDSVAWDDSNSVWYKLTQYALMQFGTDKIDNLPNDATEDDLISSNYLALCGSLGPMKIPGDCIAPKSIQDNLVVTVEENARYGYEDDTQQTETNALADNGSVSGYKVYYNSMYGLSGLQSSSFQQVHCFQVVKDHTYRVHAGRGIDTDESQPFGVVTSSRFANISGTRSYKQILIGGNTGGSLASKTFIFTAAVNGYAYVNASPSSTSLSVWECVEVSVKDKIEEIDDIDVPQIRQDLDDEIARSSSLDYLDDVYVDGETITELRVDTGYKVMYNSQYGLAAYEATTGNKVYVFAVNAGKYLASTMRGSTAENHPLGLTSGSSAISQSNPKSYRQIITNGLEGSTPSDFPNVEFDVAQDGYLYVNVNSSKTLVLKTLVKKSVKQEVEELAAAGAVALNHWEGAKIVWFGTSVPYGVNADTSYVKIIKDTLRFNLVPAFIPGEALHARYDNDSGLWYPMTYGSTCLSKAEYVAAKAAGLTNITIQSTPKPWVPGSANYNNYYRCYDNVLTADNADADLYVLDVAPNNTNFDLTDFNAFDFSNWRYSDNSAFSSHRGTFLGALLFLINEIYILNANARILLFLGSSFQYSEGKSAFSKLTAQGVELLDIWGDVNRLKPSMDVIKSLGGTDDHPSTFGHEILGKRLIGRFLQVS